MAAKFLVMLPEAATALLERRSGQPGDVTELLDEWVCFLSPVRAAREAAMSGATSFAGWTVTAHASLSGPAVRAARDTAEDEAFVAAIAATPQLAHYVQGGKLSEKALPLVLGFGVLAAMRLGIGVRGRAMRDKRREAQAAAAQRRSDSGASEQRPTLAPLGRSVPWADDGEAGAQAS